MNAIIQILVGSLVFECLPLSDIVRCPVAFSDF